MTITEFSAKSLELARRFRGRPDNYFEALKVAFPDSLLPATIERQFQVCKGKTSAKNLAPIFEELNATPTAANPRMEELGRQVAQLATSPHSTVSGPIVKGITKSLTAQEKVDARLAEARKLRTPRQKLEALRAIKNDSITEENTSHQERCAAQRCEIIARARAPFTKK